MRVHRFPLLVPVLLSGLACGDKGGSSGSTDGGTETATDSAGSETTGSSSATSTSGGNTDSASEGSSGGGAMMCTHTCTANEDCLIGGEYFGLECVDSFCVETHPCAVDDDCVVTASGWHFQPCTMGGGECQNGFVCVDLGDGSGGCAVLDNGGSCTPPYESVMRTSLDDGTDVQVCGVTNYSCDTQLGTCDPPCGDDVPCPGSLSCDAGTDMCVCQQSSDCDFFAPGLLCSEGRCVLPPCTDDAQCAAFIHFDGGTVSCE